MSRRRGDGVNRGVEGLAVGRGRLAVAAHLAHELQGSGADVVVGNGFRAAEGLDAAAHSTMVPALARHRQREGGCIARPAPHRTTPGGPHGTLQTTSGATPVSGSPGASTLTVAEHIEILEAEGRRFGDVVARTPFDAAVPSCPGWQVDRLIHHLGDVHRWAAMIVRDRVQERLRRDFEGPSDPAALVAWYLEGVGQLVDVLRAASPEDEFWSFAPAPTPLAFWARRQAHETAVHRLDAEQAAGSPTPFAARAAADGVDEWLLVASRRVRVPDGRGRTVNFAATDTAGAWRVELRDDGLRVERDVAGGDCELRASASDLLALVTNRRDEAGLDVSGDAGLLEIWRRSVRF
jgi:uncharacterized protein (TIGR03083 family)